MGNKLLDLLFAGGDACLGTVLELGKVLIEADKFLGVLSVQPFMHLLELPDGLVDFAEIWAIGILHLVPPGKLLVGLIPLLTELVAPLLQTLQGFAHRFFCLYKRYPVTYDLQMLQALIACGSYICRQTLPQVLSGEIVQMLVQLWLQCAQRACVQGILSGLLPEKAHCSAS
ncbi:hypothetical protein D9M68_632200 [compost metagenome]